MLYASGQYVGLPGHEMGNSEVGHLNLGAGRVVWQDIQRINSAIEDGSFFKNKVFLRAINQVKKKNKKLHLLGLVSDGGVHSHIDHLFALLELAKKEGAKKVYIHAITDGRDTDPLSGITYLSHLQAKIKKLGMGIIATICGRYFAMDRDSKYDRTSAAYELLVSGTGNKAEDPLHAISESYKNGVSDEFIKPTLIDRGGLVEDGDSVIFFNFRSDRARQISSMLVNKNFDAIKRKKTLTDLFLVSMIPYYEFDLGLPIYPAFTPKMVKNPLAELISNKGLTQFHTAETEKYAHVTYFFNGAHENPFPGEDRVLVPSPKVPTYDLKPEMSAEGVLDEVLKAIKKDKYSFILVNFANPDMVGHTGVFEATVKAVEKVDICVGKLLEESTKKNIPVIITADHGNAETMINVDTGEPNTEHTTNPVPIILHNHQQLRILGKASLCNVAPTILELLDINKPIEMNAESLIAKGGDKTQESNVIEYHL
jgi:2,3-bisphosphoglycerate-independent phosphoglycerate mutase